MYEAAGKIKLISETQTFPSGFMKREFVVTTAHDKYPQDLKFEMVKDKCAALDSFTNGEEVQVTFDIRGNEYNGKYYVSLSCWKLEGADGSPTPARKPQATTTPSTPEPSGSDLRNDDDDFDDDVPF